MATLIMYLSGATHTSRQCFGEKRSTKRFSNCWATGWEGAVLDLSPLLRFLELNFDAVCRSPALVPIGNNGGLCGNFLAIASYTQNNGNNQVYLRSPTFNWQPPPSWVNNNCWWNWWSASVVCQPFNVQNCNLRHDDSSYAVYACKLL